MKKCFANRKEIQKKVGFFFLQKKYNRGMWKGYER